MLADAVGGGVRQPHRHHERHVYRLDGDLVRGQGVIADDAHAQGGDREHPRLHRVGATDGQPQAQYLLDHRPLRPSQSAQQRVLGIGRLQADIQGQQQRHAVHDEGGDQADTGQAQARQAEQAFYEGIVESQVGQRAEHADRHHRAGAVDGAGEAAQDHEGHVAGQGECQAVEELHGAVHRLRRLAEDQEQRPQVP